MPRPRQNEIIRCPHFTWRLVSRKCIWYADGRSNTPSAGRHSLGTSDRAEAIRLLSQLDRLRAEELGLAPRSNFQINQIPKSLSLEDGRKLYERHITRPRVAGGVRAATQKRYRTVFDKFEAYSQGRGVTVWNGVSAQLLVDYAAQLECDGYAHKTLVNELTTLKQAIKWLIQEGHLQGMKPIELPLRKAESQPAYCYRGEEVQAMVAHCQAREPLQWLGDVIVALACTGLRIAELSSLRWSDLNMANRRLNLTDESGQPATAGQPRREIKSGRSRSFPIHRDLLAVLEGIARQDRYVFHGPRGGRLKPDTVRRILIREVIAPLTKQFPAADGERGFRHGRLHSFRHYFCSTCANNGVPERMVMDWLGHADSEMIRHYYHLHDEEAQRRMNSLNFLGNASGRSARNTQDNNQEDVEPTNREYVARESGLTQS
jgi:integrase